MSLEQGVVLLGCPELELGLELERLMEVLEVLIQINTGI